MAFQLKASIWIQKEVLGMVKNLPMWLLCSNGVLDVVDIFGNGCENFPLALGHGLLASSGG
jgi:hypothetical protein